MGFEHRRTGSAKESLVSIVAKFGVYSARYLAKNLKSFEKLRETIDLGEHFSRSI
jgi:hypothetical protein